MAKVAEAVHLADEVRCPGRRLRGGPLPSPPAGASDGLQGRAATHCPGIL